MIEEDEVLSPELAQALHRSIYLVKCLIKENKTLVKYGIDMTEFITNLGGDEIELKEKD